MAKSPDFPMANSPSSLLPNLKVTIHPAVLANVISVQQNVAKAPHIFRRPSRVIALPNISRPSALGRPNTSQHPGASKPNGSLFSSESVSLGMMASKGSVGLSSSLSKPVLLRVKVNASADVRFTTTISV